uniref:Uncharacterized protein n=1 Tax=Craspedostauros australis TaxID=1486917 RepID=A0A7R9WTP3_9STRA
MVRPKPVAKPKPVVKPKPKVAAKATPATKPTPKSGGLFANLRLGAKKPPQQPNIKAVVEVPTISLWKQNPDGTITGFVSGSQSIRNGSKITTSIVRNRVKPGDVVSTISGSKYKLAKSTTSYSPYGKTPEVAGRSKTATTAGRNANAPKQRGFNAGTGGMFGGGGGGDSGGTMAELSRWKQNRDGSITGIIRNKAGFENGTKITTSPVKSGAKKGMVIKTAAGSRYKLM